MFKLHWLVDARVKLGLHLECINKAITRAIFWNNLTVTLIYIENLSSNVKGHPCRNCTFFHRAFQNLLESDLASFRKKSLLLPLYIIWKQMKSFASVGYDYWSHYSTISKILSCDYHHFVIVYSFSNDSYQVYVGEWDMILLNLTLDFNHRWS